MSFLKEGPADIAGLFAGAIKLRLKTVIKRESGYR
jgi:hypothetical protein